jgi:hypothetical protein
VHRGLTLAQRLVDPEGVPTGTAKAILTALAAGAAAAGFVAHGGGDPRASTQRDAVIAVSYLTGHLPAEQEPSAPRLTSTARLPAPAFRPRRIRALSREPARPSTATAAPDPTAVPVPADTDAVAAPVAPVAVPTPAPAPPAAPRPQRPSGQSFDLSG